MQRARRTGRSGTRAAHVWTILSAVALLAGAAWLRALSVRYLAAAAAATVLAAVAARGLEWRARRWAAAAAAAGGIFCIAAALAQRTLTRIDDGWPAYREALASRADGLLETSLTSATAVLRAMAARALNAPASPDEAFAALRPLVEGRSAAWGVMLERGGAPAAWAGRVYAAPDSLHAPLGIVVGPFYTTLYATAERGGARAIASVVVHAEAPSDRIAEPLDAAVARRAGVAGFGIVGTSPLRARPVLPSAGEARLAVAGRATSHGAILLGLTLLLTVLGVWRARPGLLWRLAPLAVALAVLGVVRLNVFSASTRFFDPTVYFSEVAGPWSANVGTLGLSAAVLVLGLLIVLRSRRMPHSRWLAGVVVIAIMAVGPPLMRHLASGITPPTGGTSTRLWLEWELALFLASAALLIGAAGAGSAALGRKRGISPWIAPALALVAALIGPPALRAPGWWPDWYPLFWIAAIAAVAVTRGHRRLLLAAAAVAALAATTLTWDAGIRGRVALANSDVAGINAPEPYVSAALERFAPMLAGDSAPRSAGALLRAYVRSDLAGTGYPVQLRQWSPAGTPDASLQLARFTVPAAALAALIGDARRSDSAVVRNLVGVPGYFVALAVPRADGSATTVVVGPRTRLIADGEYNALLGLPPPARGTSPYTLSLADVDSASLAQPASTRWERQDFELHGDRVIETARGPARAHIEIDLRSPLALLQRGTLVVLCDLALIVALWLASTLPGGGLRRWMRGWTRRWASSYRARLIVALFGFFVLPATLFAAWSYTRLQSGDVRSRELLVREMLTHVVGGGEEAPRVLDRADSLDAPLWLYRAGELSESSDPLLGSLLPVGRFLPPSIYLSLARRHEINGTVLEQAGASPALIGYRVAVGPAGERVVLAAPARGTELSLDERRHDLAVLVLFSTVIGALGALWLSGIAARSLAEPIGRLRRAALAIAAGESEPALPGVPPVEFVPVFSAFRRMAADLGASRDALEAAQRRTAAVLRNVASGVVAFDGQGRVTLTNPRAGTMLGTAPQPGDAAASLRPKVLAAAVGAFLPDGSEEEEFPLDVGGRQLQARLTRLSNGGGGAVLTLDDITELARAQRVLAWGEMARQVAHEIKNPLTPIRLGVQHLKRARADRRPDFDQILEQNVTRILAEIDHLDEIARSFSRYGSGPSGQAPAEPVDVGLVTRDVVALERLGEGGVDWRLELAGAEPLVAHARTEELREVLLNVLENARLAEARRVEVRVEREDGRVVIEVRDDGRGIPPSVMPRLFEPHFSTRTSGSGLGLPISRRLLEGWGGEIAVVSAEGSGTTVRIALRAG